MTAVLKKMSIFFALLCATLALADDTPQFGQSRVVSEYEHEIKVETLGAPAQTIYEQLLRTPARTWEQDGWTLIRSKTIMCGRKVEVDEDSVKFRCIFFVDATGNFAEIPEASATALIGVW